MVYLPFAQKTLCVWACRSLLSSAGSELPSTSLSRSQTALTTLVGFARARDVLPLHHLALVETIHTLEGVDVEGSRSHRSSCFEDAELLLVEGLGVRETLVSGVAQVTTSSNLL